MNPRIEQAIENLRRSLTGTSSPARVGVEFTEDSDEAIWSDRSRVVSAAFTADLIPPEPDMAAIELPDGCRTIVGMNVEADFFTCAHDRRWRMSVGEPRRIVAVLVVEVDPETGEALA